jgi:magnesium transporter
VSTESAVVGSAFWALAWDAQQGARSLVAVDDVRAAYGEPDTRLWIDLTEPGSELLRELGELLGLHPLVVEDIAERNQRAKIELTGGTLHLVMFHLEYVGELLSSEVDIVLTQRFLLTAHAAEVDLRGGAFLRRTAEGYLAEGPDYLLWAITDRLVDDYFPVFDKLADELDGLEDDVMRRPSTWIVERIFDVRRELLVIRHAVMPQREIFNQLTNRDLDMIKPERVIFFRDVYDHLIRLTDELDSHRELVATTLDIYLSQVNNRLSEVVKRLTAVTVILAGAGAMAGIFGMSEAGLALSFADLRFWLVAGAIVLVSGFWLLFFRRTGWI